MTAPPCLPSTATILCSPAKPGLAFFSSVRSGLMVCALLGLTALATFANAQPSKTVGSAPVAPATRTQTAATRVAVASKPTWVDLTPMQQQTLKPLAPSWNTLSEPQKRKWLEISKNYHSLPPEGQATMHSRMNEWVALSPQQRAEARLNFAKTKELSKQLTPEEKKAKWQTYQALSPEEKQNLAAKSTTRPVGAAPAVKPVSPQKLAAVLPHGTKPEPKPAANTAPTQTSPTVTAPDGDAGAVNANPNPQR